MTSSGASIAQARRIQRPHRMNPPPETAASHRGNPAPDPDRRAPRPEPRSRERVAEQEQGRPERHLFARAEPAKEIRPDPAEGVEETERRQRSKRKTRAGLD